MNDATAELVFAALPPARGRGFAVTWWGQSWLKALEDTALDGDRVRQGRRAAGEGAVGAVSVRPGRLTAVVRSSDGMAHRADVLLRQLTGAEWDRLLDTVAGEAGHIAALLDRDMPPHLVEDAAAAGVELLPGIGDLEPECACGEWDHCAHTAALCYQVARLLDADPFVLLLLRGRGERELTQELQRRSAARAETAHAPAPGRSIGVPAREAYARADALPPLPAPPPAVTVPGTAPALGPDGGTGEEPGLDIAALEFLTGDTAGRAQRLLAEALRPGHADTPPPVPLSRWEDAVRMAAGRPPEAVAERLARGCGRTTRDLDIAAHAWGFGGPAALAVLDDAPSSATARALDQLAAAWADEESRPVLRGAGNRWTAMGEGVQLRYGPDGRWWPYRKTGGRWWPAGPAETDPAAALAVARGDGGSGRPVTGRQARSSSTG